MTQLLIQRLVGRHLVSSIATTAIISIRLHLLDLLMEMLLHLVLVLLLLLEL